MWNPIKIEIYNLFAHKESTYTFKNNACTVIFGKNKTDKGFENNGAGKTTLFEAISIALTNESLRAIKRDSFINREEEECKIIFSLYNPVLKMSLKIERIFYRKNKPVKVSIWENGELNVQITSVNEANKRIIELLGISREDLLRYYIISQDSNYTFFTTSDVDKKEVMNRITSANMINPVIEELSIRIKEKEIERNTLDLKVNKLLSKKELLEEQRTNILLEDDTDEEIKEVEDQIKEKEEKLLDIEKIILNLTLNLKDKQKEIDDIVIEDTTKLKKSRKKIQLQYDSLDNDITENKKIRNKLTLELEDAIVCPNCSHKFIYKSELELSIEDATKLLKEVNIEIKNQQKTFEDKKLELKTIKEKISNAQEKENSLETLKSEKRRLLRKIENFNEDKKDAEKKKLKLEQEKIDLQEHKKNDKLLKDLDDRMIEYDNEKKLVEKKLVPITEEIEMIKFWQFNMGKSGFTTYLANKSIKIIEGITNSYLKKFKVDISVLINGFVILKSKKVREKIDVFISNDGIAVEPFLAKSGGERGRVTLAGVLGIQHLINTSTGGKGLNLLCFDESFHGMDPQGQENIIKIFEKIGITTLVITQNVSESFNNENTLYVVKENDVSKYI